MKNCMREKQYQSNNKLGQNMGNYVFFRNLPFAQPKLSCNLNIFTFPKLHNLSSNQPCQRCPVRQRHTCDHSLQPFSHSIGNQDQQQNMRNSHNSVNCKRDGRVHLFPKSCCTNSKNQCHNCAYTCCQHANKNTHR